MTWRQPFADTSGALTARSPTLKAHWKACKTVKMLLTMPLGRAGQQMLSFSLATCLVRVSAVLTVLSAMILPSGLGARLPAQIERALVFVMSGCDCAGASIFALPGESLVTIIFCLFDFSGVVGMQISLIVLDTLTDAHTLRLAMPARGANFRPVLRPI